MKANLKNVLLVGRFFLLGALCAGTFTACSDDDPDPVSLVTPVKSGDAVATLNSLTFSWQSVENAASYSYVLKNAGTEVKSGTTAQTSVNFTGLTAGTTYTLEVTAVPASTSKDYLNSAALTLTGTTLDYIQLGKPNPSVSSQEGASVVLTWAAVSNADSYTYTIAQGETVLETKEIAATQVEYTAPAQGDYTLGVIAHSTNEQYTDSDEGSVSFSYVVKELWTVEGQFSGGGYTWTANLAAYDDGTYAILAWYGNEGCDLKFSVDDNAGIVPTNAVSEGNDWYEIAVGQDFTTWIYTKNFTDSRYSKFEGTQETGALYFWDNGVNSWLDFVWPVPEETEEPSEGDQNGDDQNGESTATTYEGTWTKPDGTVVTATIILNEDGSYTIKNWYGTEGYDFTFTVDESGAITPSSEYYVSDNWWWIPYGDGENDGSWIYVTGGYGALDSTGVWFWDKASNSYYWMKFEH